MSEQQMSTDADVESTAFTDRGRVEGEHEASSVRAVMINRPRRRIVPAASRCAVG